MLNRPIGCYIIIMREFTMDDYDRFINLTSCLFQKNNVYDTFVLADKQWDYACIEIKSISQHLDLFLKYADSQLRKKEAELVFSISETLFWRLTFLKNWKDALNITFDKEIESPFNPWVLARIEQISELQKTLVSTNFQTHCRGENGNNIFAASNHLYSSILEHSQTLFDEGYDQIDNIDEWNHAIGSFICGIHKFDAKEDFPSDLMGDFMEKYLSAVNQVLFEFQKMYYPYINTSYTKRKKLPSSESISHIEVFRKSNYYHRIRDNFSNITTRKELEIILNEDEHRYAPLLKQYKTSIIDKTVPALSVETAIKGFSNWMDLLTVAALLQDHDEQQDSHKANEIKQNDHFPPCMSIEQGRDLHRYLVAKSFIDAMTDMPSFLYLMGCTSEQPTELKLIPWCQNKQLLRDLLEHAFLPLLESKSFRFSDLEELTPKCFVKNGKPFYLAKRKRIISYASDIIKKFFAT